MLGPGLPAVLAFIEAMLIARRRADLAPQIKATLDRLHEEGARATSEVMARKRWRMMTTPEIAAQNFWATITGVALQMVASGTTAIGSGIDALALVELNLVDRQSGPEIPAAKNPALVSNGVSVMRESAAKILPTHEVTNQPPRCRQSICSKATSRWLRPSGARGAEGAGPHLKSSGQLAGDERVQDILAPSRPAAISRSCARSRAASAIARRRGRISSGLS